MIEFQYIYEAVMKLHEYQAKELLSSYGVPIPKGSVATNPQQAASATTELGNQAVIKAQVHAGGRGKAGGVKLVASPAEAEKFAESLIGSVLITAQTGSAGAPVNSLLIEQTMNIERELYLSITTDGNRKRPVIIASQAGGMEIEEVAESDPDQIITEAVDPAIGVQPFQARIIAQGLNIEGKLVRTFGQLIDSMYRAFMEKDLSMVEINPLVITSDGDLFALDAKVSYDDDAMFRHPTDAKLRDYSQEDELEVAASKEGISYVRLDGDVGCMVNGAGLAMATMDTINKAGAAPANFLDVGGGADELKVSKAIQLMLSDDGVERVLVNVFGGILRCDVVARGIVDGYLNSSRKPKLVARLLGTNADQGKEILQNSDIDAVLVSTLGEVADAISSV